MVLKTLPDLANSQQCSPSSTCRLRRKPPTPSFFFSECSLCTYFLPSFPPISKRKSLLNTRALHLPVSLYQSLTNLARSGPPYNFVVGRDFSSIVLQRKNWPVCLIRISKNLSFESIIFVEPTLLNLFHIDVPSSLQSPINSRPLIGQSIRRSRINLSFQTCTNLPHCRSVHK